MNKYDIPEGILNRIKNNYTEEDLEKMQKLSKKQNKYRNKKITIDGHTFPSIKEGNRYCELKILLKAGEISELILQPSFIICPSVVWNGRKICTKKYIADFQYCVDGLKSLKVVEDVKGKRTVVYMLKRSLFLSQYPEYDFREV